MPHRRSARSQVIAQRGDLVVEGDPARPSGRRFYQAGMEASYTDLADPRHVEFDYLRWIRVLLVDAGARRVLHVGGAGCALARALAAADPDGRQEVWEIDPDVVAFAREWLGLRRAPGLRVRVGDGARALAGAGDRSRDAVVIDAFLRGRVAPGPTAPAALAHAARVAPLTVVNVVGEGEVERIAAGLIAVYPRVWSVAGRSGNTVLGGDRDALDLVRVGSPLARDRSPAALAVLQQ
jgi:hypothetical protein